MTPEERKILEETHDLVRKNNELLVYMKRRGQVGTVIKILYWAVIIALSLGALYAIKPYIEFLKGFGGSSQGSSSAGISQQIQDLLK